jgi:hypothetical protein
MRNRTLLLIAILSPYPFLSGAALLSNAAMPPQSASSQPQKESQANPAPASPQQKLSADEQAASLKQPPAQPVEESTKNTPKQKHHINVRFGGITVGAGYTHFSGPYDPYGPFGYYPYGWSYASLLWNPFWPGYPALLPHLAYSSDKGEIKLTTDLKNADVYIDGAYAGSAFRLKSMW